MNDEQLPSPSSPRRRLIAVGESSFKSRAGDPRDVRGRRLIRYFFGPVAATLIVQLLTPNEPFGPSALGLVFFTFAAGALAARGASSMAVHLPLVDKVAPVIGPSLGVTGYMVLAQATTLPSLDPHEVAIVIAAGAIIVALGDRAFPVGRRSHLRVGVLGSSQTTAELVRELQVTGTPGYEVVGRIEADDSNNDGADAEGDARVDLLQGVGGLLLGPGSQEPEAVRTLGTRQTLAETVTREHLDLLLLAPDTPRLEIWQELAQSCTHLPVRVVEHSDFCERVFGHVPISSINAMWFQQIMHPDFSVSEPRWKRVLDFAFGVAALGAFLPVLAVLALLIRRDGGPALFRQNRIGEGGRPFTLYKLRSMRVDADSYWTSANDPRVTRIGGLIRRTHLDELPQLLNVIKGDMSLVGPRPEQPSFVTQLEEQIPFYSRRHLVKPGITGWAQVRGGYAGSLSGAARKLCYDLFYVRHRSFALDGLILVETLRTAIADRQYPELDEGPSLFLSEQLRPRAPEALAPASAPIDLGVAVEPRFEAARTEREKPLVASR